jgi:hypothetical protein
MQVGDRDLFSPNLMRDNMHDWVVANENMARVLAAKGYHYQFVFNRNAGHCDRPASSTFAGHRPSAGSGSSRPSTAFEKYFVFI